jgi:hypothetical protein
MLDCPNQNRLSICTFLSLPSHEVRARVQLAVLHSFVLRAIDMFCSIEILFRRRIGSRLHLCRLRSFSVPRCARIDCIRVCLFPNALTLLTHHRRYYHLFAIKHTSPFFSGSAEDDKKPVADAAAKKEEDMSPEEILRREAKKKAKEEEKVFIAYCLTIFMNKADNHLTGVFP